MIITALSWISYIQSLHKIIYELENGVQLGKMKDKLVMKKVKQQLMNEEIVDMLMNKMGVFGISKKQEEIVQMIADLKNDLKARDKPSSL